MPLSSEMNPVPECRLWTFYLRERIKKMQLKEGSFVNINGSLTEEVWTEGEGDNQVKKSAQVIVLDSRDSIEYTSGGGKKSINDTQAQGSSQKKGASL